MKRWIAVVATVLAIAGCASGGGSIDPKDETVSLVYGYFDMADAPTKADWVWLRKYEAGKEATGYNMASKDGVFFHVGVEPGSYQVEKFGGGGGFFSRPVEYSFGGSGRNGTAIRIARPGVYFVGSHRYVNHAGKGFFDPDRFEMQAAGAPSEKEVLQRVVQRLETEPELKDYRRQIELARKRLAELR
ncbi:MAG TPA: hypothetical protein VG873_17290 [Burkholderiales bacterium]|nr:hypothetical protein [Burkholderiales bacterium]